MAIDFRCENCGKLLLRIEAEPSSKVKCPYCKAEVLVPAGLASLPRPQVPSHGDKVDTRPDQPSPLLAEEEILIPERSDAMMGVMAMLMPWVISLLFHAAVLVILAFVVIVTTRNTLKADVVVPDVPLSDTISDTIAGDTSPELTAKSLQRGDDWWAERIPSANLGRTENKIQLYGSAGGSEGGARAQLGLSAGTGGPKSRFMGMTGSAYHIVYVVDRSGSMLETFDAVRKEIIRSVGGLSREQTFHVIFFAEGKPMENPPLRLVYAQLARKKEALEFLNTIKPGGGSEGGWRSDPIPALEKAFAVMSKTPGDKQGKLIYLLTDGEFRDNDKVLAAIRNMNAKRDVHINTILYNFRSPELDEFLDRIAKENGGTFKFVGPDE